MDNPKPGRASVPDVWVVHTSAIGLPLEAQELGQILERVGVFHEVSAFENLRFDSSSLPRIILLVANEDDALTLRIIEHLQRRMGPSSPPLLVIAAQPSLDLRMRGFLKGASGFISYDAFRSKPDILEHTTLPQDITDIGFTGLNELVEYCTNTLKTNIVRSKTHSEQDGKEIQILLGDGRGVATTLASFVEGLTSFVAGHFHATSQVKKNPTVINGVLKSSPLAHAKRRVYDGARFIVAFSNPVRCDLIARELRALGGWVAVCDYRGEDLERFSYVDPHIVFVDSADALIGGNQLIESIQKEARLRWASVVTIQWDVLCPFDQLDGRVLQKQLEQILSKEKQMLSTLRKKGRVELDLADIGPCRVLRALIAESGEWRIDCSSVHSTCSVRVNGELVVRAEAQGWDNAKSKPIKYEGMSAMAAWILMKGGHVRIERTLEASMPNIVMPLDELLYQAYLPPGNVDKRVVSPALQEPFMHEASGTVRVIRPLDRQVLVRREAPRSGIRLKEADREQSPEDVLLEHRSALESYPDLWNFDDDFFSDPARVHSERTMILAVEHKWGLVFFGTLILITAAWMFWSLVYQGAL